MKLFSIIAGESAHTFSIGGIDFRAAPLTLREQQGYYAAVKEGTDEAMANLLADRLRVRIVGVKDEDRERVTGEWFAANVHGPALSLIVDLLLNGEHEKKALTAKLRNL